MKLEVGMYARTIRGKIFKVNEINVVGKYYYLDVRKERKIVKADYDIIDLIEQDDLIEIEFYSPRYKKRVTRLFAVELKNNNDIIFANTHCQLIILNGSWNNEDKLLKPVFKSIVTKEQFESIKYKLKE